MHNIKSVAAALAFASFAAPAFADERVIKEPEQAQAVETRAAEAAVHASDKTKPEHATQAQPDAAPAVTANAQGAEVERKRFGGILTWTSHAGATSVRAEFAAAAPGL